ncbi:MAG: hypothetical protein JWM86_1556 [Thermoleophilia bacterium]|nr:hypothetical protein [Thermoleophilia bacterium]
MVLLLLVLVGWPLYVWALTDLSDRATSLLIGSVFAAPAAFGVLLALVGPIARMWHRARHAFIVDAGLHLGFRETTARPEGGRAEDGFGGAWPDGDAPRVPLFTSAGMDKGFATVMSSSSGDEHLGRFVTASLPTGVGIGRWWSAQRLWRHDVTFVALRLPPGIESVIPSMSTRPRGLGTALRSRLIERTRERRFESIEFDAHREVSVAEAADPVAVAELLGPSLIARLHASRTAWEQTGPDLVAYAAHDVRSGAELSALVEDAAIIRAAYLGVVPAADSSPAASAAGSTPDTRGRSRLGMDLGWGAVAALAVAAFVLTPLLVRLAEALS